MKNVLFIAPPAAGKGTLCKQLVENLGYVQISTGDLLRELDDSTELGKRVHEIQAKGELVSDEIIMELLEEKLKTLNGKHFILDGCIRNIRQVALFERLLDKLELKLEKAIVLDVPYDMLVERVTGRLNCPKCGEIYNKTLRPPVKEGICDKCGESLVSREDDNLETFKKRYEIYRETSPDVINYYWDTGRIYFPNVVKDTYEEIVSEISK